MTSTQSDLSALFGRALSGDAGPGSAAWESPALPALAAEHGITALLWQALGGVGGRAGLVRDALEPGVRAAAARELLVQREMRSVLDALAAADVRTLVIKGSALAYTVYPEPWLRPRTDTDLLVREDSVPAATRALEVCGYTRCDAISTGVFVSHQVAFERTDTHGLYHVIDLHWKIANPQVVADSLPFDALWDGAQPAPALGAHARVPSAVASIALACIHRLAHHQGHDRLIWLYDLKLLTASLGEEDWMALRSLACSRGVASLCLDGLREARARLCSGLPADVEAALATAARAEPSRSYVEGLVRKRDVLVSDLRALGTWGARARLLREHMFPSPAFIRQRYGTRARWLLPAFYMHRLVTGAFKWVRP